MRFFSFITFIIILVIIFSLPVIGIKSIPSYIGSDWLFNDSEIKSLWLIVFWQVIVMMLILILIVFISWLVLLLLEIISLLSAVFLKEKFEVDKLFFNNFLSFFSFMNSERFMKNSFLFFIKILGLKILFLIIFPISLIIFVFKKVFKLARK